jgi:hypothetical protein
MMETLHLGKLSIQFHWSSIGLMNFCNVDEKEGTTNTITWKLRRVQIWGE